MEERVLLEMIAFIRNNGRLPEVHAFNMAVRRSLGGEGRAALTELVTAQKVRINGTVGYYPTLNALRWLRPELVTPEIETARRILPIVQAHYEEHQGQPLLVNGIAVEATPGGMRVPFVALFCSGGPVFASGADTEGGAETITVEEAALDLDLSVWPLEPATPAASAPNRITADTLLLSAVDEWANRLDLVRWRRWTEPFLGVKPMLYHEDHERLLSLYDWLRSRVYPTADHPVVVALENFRSVLRDFLLVIEQYGEHIERPSGLAITKSYKRRWIDDPNEFQRLADNWQRSIDELGNLAFELARSVNLVLSATRQALDFGFHFELGKVPIAGPLTADLTQDWLYPEYAQTQRYPGRDAFFAGEYLQRDFYFVLPADEKRKVRGNRRSGEGPSPDSPAPAAKDEVLLSWLHISDLHLGHGDAEHHFDQDVVLRELLADVKTAHARGVPRHDCILVTGDVAFSGGADKANGAANSQYAEASAWIHGLCVATGVPEDGVLVVPGNHDVIRPRASKSRNLGRLLKQHRDGTPVDEALRDDGDRAMLLEYQEYFWAFAKQYGCDDLFWERTHVIAGGPRVRFVGLNTSLLALDDQDKEKLQLGMAQVAFLTKNAVDGDVTVVLTHHPVGEEWLSDRERAQSHLMKHATVHLHGHTHRPGSLTMSRGDGALMARVVAGAAHSEKREPQSHGYNSAALVRTHRGLVLRVWPRRWYPDAAGFRVDSGGLREGRVFADLKLYDAD